MMGTEEITANLNHRYLVAETRQVSLLVQRQLQRAIFSQKEAADPFRGLYVSNQDAENILQLLQLDQDPSVSPPENETTDPIIQALSTAQVESQAVEEEAAHHGIRLKLQKIRGYFNLSNFEYAAFIVCLLPALDLRYEKIYGYLQDDVTRRQSSVDLIIRLLEGDPGLTGLNRMSCFSSHGMLVKYRLLRPVNPSTPWLEPRLNQLFEVSPAIVSWLVGDYFPEETWLRFSTWEDLAGLQSAETKPNPLSLDWEMILAKLPLLAFDGDDAEAQVFAAYQVALYYQMPILEVDLNEVCGEKPLDLGDLRLMIRDACLLETVLFIQGWDRVLDENGFIPVDVLDEMASFVGLFILGSQSPWRISRSGNRPVLQVHFDTPSSAERAVIWEETLGGSPDIGREDIRILSSQFALTGGQIRNAVFYLQNKASVTGQPATAQDLFSAARQQSSHHLGQLAQKIEPRYGWGDIILPNTELETLGDIVSMMRYRSVVLEEWGLGKKLTANRGLSALFTGEPGTGKTLAAQVIAAELQMDLYRIDLSNVVSKYIGETEKNLEKIFQEARNSNAILFFDEADALFGKRSEVKDAHDRYANIEVGYLLQRMEIHDGITVLATNLSSNMDDAFTRRLNFIVHFPFPDEQQRLSIWKVLVPPSLPIMDDIDWAYLAASYPIAGGNIRNILVSSAYLAARDGKIVDMEHILLATRREMQKMGRLIREEDYRYLPKSKPGA